MSKHFSLTFYEFNDEGKVIGVAYRTLDNEASLNRDKLKVYLEQFSDRFDDVTIPSTSDF